MCVSRKSIPKTYPSSNFGSTLKIWLIEHFRNNYSFHSYPEIFSDSPEALLNGKFGLNSHSFNTDLSGIKSSFSTEIKLTAAQVSIRAGVYTMLNSRGILYKL